MVMNYKAFCLLRHDKLMVTCVATLICIWKHHLSPLTCITSQISTSPVLRMLYSGWHNSYTKCEWFNPTEQMIVAYH